MRVHVVIMGCGRVGSGLAKELEAAGHSISIIDQNREAFRRLGPDFKGRTIAGVGFDKDILLEAGIQNAGGFAAVSNGDNSNILAARVARETYNVSNVVARIYSPERAEIYQRLGIPTVATVLWTTDQIIRRLAPGGSHSEWRDASGTIELCEVALHKGWFGKPITLLEKAADVRVALITRLGEGVIPNSHTVIQSGDLVHVTLEESRRAEVDAILLASPESE